MSLPPGSRLGLYEVIGPIGSGGMGEVYRARDTRLERDVAVKVLPDLVSSDHQRIARFEREARALATLNHPNVAAIYGLEEVSVAGSGHRPFKALILELVEGETLSERLLRGPLPPEEALAIAEQIADALEAAHEKGIIHRDLKPSNVKITPSGLVKVLDFGLAKMVADTSNDPSTVTLATGPAGILGTPAYMAPEQAQGQPVDKRVDVWAFGVLLYEMLAGHRPFRGASVQDTLSAVLTTDPDWDRIPPRVQPLVRRCLERDPRRRLRDLGDFRLLLEYAPRTDPSAARQARPWLLVTAGTVVTAVALAFAVWMTSRPRTPSPGEPVRLTTMLPPGVSVTRGAGFASSVAVSPDGRTLVIAGSGQDGQRLYRRPLDRLEAAPLGGTERGSSPFFSWDGAWIGFFADGRLKRIPAAGGAAVDIVDVPGFPAGASWGPDDRIVFAYGAHGGLHSVAARGGNAEPLPGVDSGYRPEVLPDGRTVLFEADGWIHAVDRVTARRTRLVQGTAPRYAIGHIILSRATTLMAAPFDVSRHELTGPLVPLVEGVALEASAGGGMHHYTLCRAGTLAYVPAADAYSLAIVNADGTERLVVEAQRSLENPRFSPDGRMVVVAAARRDGEPSDLWVHDIKTGTATRLTFNGGRAPLWMPDGSVVTYSHLGEQAGIYTSALTAGGTRGSFWP